jgi:glycosyltransferase involved in cell wall biosynthesis
MKHSKLLVIANNNIGYDLSGGDRILVNLIKYLSDKFFIMALGSEETKTLLTKYFVLPLTFLLSDTANKKTFLNTIELIIHQIRRTIFGIICIQKNIKLLKNVKYIYTASDFYPDFFLGFFLKILKPSSIWLCGYYLLAPNPFQKGSNYNQSRQIFRGLIYFLGQLPSRLVAKHFADFVFVTSEPDIKYFKSERLSLNKIIIVQGGVDRVDYQQYRNSSLYISPTKRKYDAVYLGRFHTQKGVTQLIEIWHNVVQQLPDAKLIMIGDGELKSKISSLIDQYNLQNNITLTGFLDGDPKIKIFQNSKIVVHPAIYDSGGMAAAEAMSWGLPGVSYDLEALKTYYPKGMVKSPINNLSAFSDIILKLLSNKKFYQKLSTEALSLTQSSWDWQIRFDKIYHQII